MKEKPWNDDCECSDCELEENLMCTGTLKYSIYFGAPMLLALIPPIIGILFSGFSLLIKVLIFVGWVAYALFFFTIWESRMLCNHCPYYADDSQKTLHCPINKGMLKTSKYDPSPINTSEKIQFIIGALILVWFPIPFLLFDGQIISILLLLGGFALWLVVIQLKVCTDCINFSCVLNRVPEEIRNEFLNKNPQMKKAWKEAGYDV